MKRFFLLLMITLGFTAVSCSPATVNEDNLESDSGDGLISAPEADPDIFLQVTETPTPAGNPVETESLPDSADGYPAPPTPLPLPDGYVIPTQPPPLNSYPEATGNLVWILKPVGEQCAETPVTPDLNTAVADMIAFGIPVVTSELTDLPVCSACGCPTSAHFRMQIDAGYLGNAEVLGWVQEQ